MAESYSRWTFSSLETAKLFSKVVVPFTFPPAGCESSSFSTSSPTVGKVSLLNFSHSNKCVEVACDFNMHFPND